jgi:integrase/recombinase XerD
MLTLPPEPVTIASVAKHPPEARRSAAGKATAEFQRLVDGWVSTLRAANTRAAYRSDLAQYARWCAAHAVDPLRPSPSAMGGYRTACESDGARPASVARRLSAVGSFLRYADGHGAPGASVALADLERPDAGATSSTRVLTAADAGALLDAADLLHPKAALLVRLLMLDGLKVGEAVGAEAEDLSGRPPRMTLRLDRNGQTQVLPLHTDTASAARAYLDGRRNGPLLLSDSFTRIPTRLTRFGADYVLKRVADIASLGAGISANALRRRYVAAAHARGTDLDDIRRRAGHVEERTTLRYLPQPPTSG